MILAFFFSLLIGVSQTQKIDLPAGAKIIEQRVVQSDRAIILWMLNPKRNPREFADEIYTCPEYTRGHYYSGQTRVSLLDLKTNKIINTVEIKGESGDVDQFDVPYKIARGYYYQVAKSKTKEAKAQILALKDFNRDGKAHEFALYEAVACMGLPTALIGYSEKQDKIIQYQTVLTSKDKTTTLDWVDYLFSKTPNKNGVWKYEIDYRGRGGTLDQYNIRYNAKLERFEGTLTFTE